MNRSQWKELLTDIACLPALAAVLLGWVIVGLILTAKRRFE